MAIKTTRHSNSRNCNGPRPTKHESICERDHADGSGSKARKHHAEAEAHVRRRERQKAATLHDQMMQMHHSPTSDNEQQLTDRLSQAINMINDLTQRQSDMMKDQTEERQKRT